MNSRRLIFVLISVAAILNAMFVPIFEMWGGLFPKTDNNSFFEIVNYVLKEQVDWERWDVQMTAIVFFSSVFMLIMAFIGAKIPFLIASGLGVLAWGKEMIGFIIQYNEYGWLEGVLDVEEGNLCIGWYVAIALFVSGLIAALTSKPKSKA